MPELFELQSDSDLIFVVSLQASNGHLLRVSVTTKYRQPRNACLRILYPNSQGPEYLLNRHILIYITIYPILNNTLLKCRVVQA